MAQRQIAVLLRLFVGSALADFNSSSKDEEFVLDKELLSRRLTKDLPALIVRYRDDSSNLEAVLKLLPHCNLLGSSAEAKSLFHVLSETVSHTRERTVIQCVATALKQWRVSAVPEVAAESEVMITQVLVVEFAEIASAKESVALQLTVRQRSHKQVDCVIMIYF